MQTPKRAVDRARERRRYTGSLVARLSDEHLEPFIWALEAHRREPHVTWNAHRLTRLAELWRMAEPRKRLYLETRYWVFVRDAAMGGEAPVHDDLLAILRRLVASGTAICPLSDGAMFELHKQIDPETRVAMARVMDALSLGAMIQNGMERMRTELVRFFYPSSASDRRASCVAGADCSRRAGLRSWPSPPRSTGIGGRSNTRRGAVHQATR